MTASEQLLKDSLARAEVQLERQSGIDQAAWRMAEPINVHGNPAPPGRQRCRSGARFDAGLISY